MEQFIEELSMNEFKYKKYSQIEEILNFNNAMQRVVEDGKPLW